MGLQALDLNGNVVTTDNTDQITVSAGGIIRSANRAACELFGYTGL